MSDRPFLEPESTPATQYFYATKETRMAPLKHLCLLADVIKLTVELGLETWYEWRMPGNWKFTPNGEVRRMYCVVLPNGDWVFARDLLDRRYSDGYNTVGQWVMRREDGVPIPWHQSDKSEAPEFVKADYDLPTGEEELPIPTRKILADAILALYKRLGIAPPPGLE